MKNRQGLIEVAKQDWDAAVIAEQAVREAREAAQREKDLSRLRRAILPRNLGKLGGRGRATGYLYE